MPEEPEFNSHATLRAYLHRLEESIAQVRHRLEALERAYGQDTGTIFSRIRNGELDLTEEFEQWAGEREMLRRLVEQQEALEARLK